MKYEYRVHFGLTSLELESEPVDEFFTNLFIIAQIKEKKRLMDKHG